DAFIGMRLHGCLLSMLAGTPAMGLGYESKTQEIFGQLGLSSYQVDFESEKSSWVHCADRFLADIPSIRTELPLALDRLCERARANLSAIEQVYQSSRPSLPRATSVEYFGVLAEKQWREQSSLAAAQLAEILPTGTSFILVDDGQLD